MEVYIYQGEKRNIGDDLDFWFLEEMMGQAALKKDNHLLVGFGTILDDRLPKSKTMHVLGSVAGYGKITDCSDWNVHFVRGHLTANALKCDSSAVISDLGILISRLKPKSVIKKHRTSFMPHVGIYYKKYKNFINQLGWNYISPSDEENSVLENISASENLITSAMHGAIIGDSYLTPWLSVSTSHEILLFKWQDWFSSLGLEVKLNVLPPMWPHDNQHVSSRIKQFFKSSLLESKLNNLEKNGRFVLSDSEILLSKQQLIIDKVRDIQREFTRQEVYL